MAGHKSRHARHRADVEKREVARKERLKESSQAADLDDALNDTFPASDPPSMIQPRTQVGAPRRDRRAR